ncbi:hypothetical protein M1D49_08060 [Bacillus sp. PK3-056]|uniref:hypothetical protein n=1 Tax=Niallia circulans TaxID=1397 RepID=UPI000F45488C|nr:hypothetical protein [Niallia circulans]AYV74311.1 hypothetical protein C2H98_23640 [Niallia circulans]
MKKFTESEKSLIRLILQAERSYKKLADSICVMFATYPDSDLIDNVSLFSALGLDHSDLAYDIICGHNRGELGTEETISAIEHYINGDFDLVRKVVDDIE